MLDGAGYQMQAPYGDLARLPEGTWSPAVWTPCNYFSDVRAVGRSIPPQRRPIRFRLALRTYAPWGVPVRVGELAKSRGTPT